MISGLDDNYNQNDDDHVQVIDMLTEIQGPQLEWNEVEPLQPPASLGNNQISGKKYMEPRVGMEC